MIDDTEILTKNTLFLAVTRPALWAGIPIEAAVLLLISSASVLIESNSPVAAALVVAFGYSISRLIVRHDVNAFRLLFLWGRTKAGNRNRAFWGGSSYSPLPLSGLRRKGFGRHD
jgi:type IV secretion system protein VirB3